jgi:hypothetical protein
LGKVVHTVKRDGTYAAKVPPQEVTKITVCEWDVEKTKRLSKLQSFDSKTNVLPVSSLKVEHE